MSGLCDSGSGAFIGMTVVLDAHCLATGDNGNEVVETQSLIRLASDPVTVSALLLTTELGPWTVTKDVFDKPRTDDGCGSLRRKGFGCDRDHDAWTAAIEFNGEFDLMLLVGAKGTIRRTNPDGSYREGEGEFVSATVFPAQIPGELSTGEVSVQWVGGKPSDPGYPTYVPAP